MFTSLYSHLVITAAFLLQQNAHTFAYEKTPLNAPIRQPNVANGHIVKGFARRNTVIGCNPGQVNDIENHRLFLQNPVKNNF